MAVQQTDLGQVRAALRAWDRRLRFQHSVIWLPRGLAGGLLLAILLAVAARLWPLVLRDTLIRLSALLALLGVAAALIGVWAWRRSLLDLARRFDRLFGLKERLSTALELSEGLIPVESEALAALQRIDAVRSTGDVRPGRSLAFRADWREWAVAAIALGGLALAIFLPNPQELVVAERAEVQQAIAEQIEELEDLRQQALEDATLTEDQRQVIVETLDEAIQTLSQPGVTQQEALAALDAAEAELREFSQQPSSEGQEALSQVGALLEQTGAEGAAEALEQGDPGAAQTLAEALGAMTEAERQALADQLEAQADRLEGADPQAAESLREAAEALRSGDVQGAAESLAEAGQQMAGSGSPAVEEYADKVRKGEAEVAEAGQNAPAQPGQGGMGQASPYEPAPSGQAGQSSQGQGQTDEGSGGDGVDPGQVAGETPRGGGAPDGGETPFDDIYAPQRIGGEGGEQMDVPTGQGVPIQEGQLAENPTGEASVPYTQVWGDYAGVVNQALESGYIPLGMRSVIQQYFSRLEPEP